ncbi:MAG: MFS transporter [Planctomycetota bacterium]
MAGGGSGWVRMAPILAVQFIGTLGYSIAIPFLVFLVADLGGASWTFGLLGATYSLSQLVGAPVLGRWSDRFGRRPVLIASQAGTLLAWVVFLLALELPVEPLGTLAGATLSVPLLLIFGARMLDGLTGGNISVANAYVADLTSGDESARQVAFGRMGMASSLGFTLGPALAGLLGAGGDGYTEPIVAAAVISAIGMLLCLTLREPRQRCPEGPPAQPTVTRVLGQQQRRCDTAPKADARASLRRPIVVGLLGATFAQFLAFSLFYAGFPLHATQEIGWGAAELGVFYTVLSAAMLVVQGPVLARLAGRLAPKTLFALGMAGLALAQLTFAQGNASLLFGGALLFAAGNGIAWPTFQARTADAATEAEQGIVQGAATSAGAVGSIAGLTLGGIAYPWLGSGLFVVAAGVFLAVLAAAPTLFGRGPGPRASLEGSAGA